MSNEDRVIPHSLILLQNPENASTRLSINGKTHMLSTSLPFVLRNGSWRELADLEEGMV